MCPATQIPSASHRHLRADPERGNEAKRGRAYLCSDHRHPIIVWAAAIAAYVRQHLRTVGMFRAKTNCQCHNTCITAGDGRFIATSSRVDRNRIDRMAFFLRENAIFRCCYTHTHIARWARNLRHVRSAHFQIECAWASDSAVQTVAKSIDD